jgi:hypothetical protein
VSDVNADLVAWKAFAARVTLTFPFRVDVLVKQDETPREWRTLVGVEVHVPDRDTREPITVLTRRHVGPFVSDEEGIDLIFELLEIALRHEMSESVRLDGKLVRDQHARVG